MEIGVGISLPSYRFGGDPLAALIAALFANGEQGGFYDAASMDGQFVDNLGRVPVTAAGDQVGFKPDRRSWSGQTFAQVMAAQPELRASGAGTATGGWTESGGIVTASGSAGTDNVTFPLTTPTVAGKRYLVTVPNTMPASGFYVDFGSGTGSQVGDLSGATQSLILTCTSPGTVIRVGRWAGSVSGQAGPISVKEIPGNHRDQAMSASRTILAREPVGGRRNLLTRTEDFANAAWQTFASASKVGVAPIAGPNGGQAYELNMGPTGGVIGAAGAVYQGVTLAAGQHVVGIYVRAKTGSSSIRVSGYSNSNAVGTDDVAISDSAWTFIPFSFTYVAGSPNVALRNNVAGNSGNIYVAMAQLELGSAPSAYQKVVSTHDVTEAGKEDCWFWFNDGIDDGDVTGSVDFSGGDEIFVCSTVRKLSNASGVVLEASADANVNNGAFALYAPSASGKFTFRTRGTATADALTTDAAFNAPVSAIVTGTSNISADDARIRLDGIEVDQETGDQGSGNFGNYPIYFGRRGGSSQPFSGREYCTVIRAGIPSGDQIAAVERLLATRQGRTI